MNVCWINILMLLPTLEIWKFLYFSSANKLLLIKFKTKNIAFFCQFACPDYNWDWKWCFQMIIVYINIHTFYKLPDYISIYHSLIWFLIYYSLLKSLYFVWGLLDIWYISIYSFHLFLPLIYVYRFNLISFIYRVGFLFLKISI